MSPYRELYNSYLHNFVRRYVESAMAIPHENMGILAQPLEKVYYRLSGRFGMLK